jgi:adenylate kinase
MSKPPDIIVIVGLSGVGKSYVIEQLKLSSDRFVNFSAGTLIKKRRSNMGRDELRLLDEEEILQNQYLLVEQFIEEINLIDKNKTILFDAHMLIDASEKVVEIPLEIFSKINPSQFIFLHEDPNIILDRRLGDASRKRPNRSFEEIRSQQNRSLDIVKEYAQQLNIPLSHYTSQELISQKHIFSPVLG